MTGHVDFCGAGSSKSKGGYKLGLQRVDFLSWRCDLAKLNPKYHILRCMGKLLKAYSEFDINLIMPNIEHVQAILHNYSVFRFHVSTTHTFLQRTHTNTHTQTLMSILHFAKAQLITVRIILRYCTGLNKIVCTRVGKVLKMVKIAK